MTKGKRQSLFEGILQSGWLLSSNLFTWPLFPFPAFTDRVCMRVQGGAKWRFWLILLHYWFISVWLNAYQSQYNFHCHLLTFNPLISTAWLWQVQQVWLLSSKEETEWLSTSMSFSHKTIKTIKGLRILQSRKYGRNLNIEYQSAKLHIFLRFHAINLFADTPASNVWVILSMHISSSLQIP